MLVFKGITSTCHNILTDNLNYGSYRLTVTAYSQLEHAKELTDIH